MEGLGLDFKLVIIQVANFLILLFILKRWVYKPLIKFLDQRAERIQESLKASEKMQRERRGFEEKKNKELLQLKERSQTVLAEVRREALAEKQTILNEGQKEVQAVVAAARTQIELEKKKALKEVGAEVASLSLEIAKKILSNLEEKQAHQIIQESLKEAEDKAHE